MNDSRNDGINIGNLLSVKKHKLEGVTKIKTNESKSEITPSSIYLMHKYWGKKPSKDLRTIINKYTKRDSTVLDPFAGFGGIGIEGVLLNRNVILNDLNPIATFIEETVLNPDVDLNVFETKFKILKEAYNDFSRKWYSFNGKKIISILRSNKDVPLKLKLYNEATKKTSEYELDDAERQHFQQEENEYEIKEWYPDNTLIRNSRISVKDNMRISNLFSKRELICQAYLYDLIEKSADSSEKELFKLAFTSNLANCSKLVTPIDSRGDMSQGAWMTGFYIGEKYLENNVFHYFENRVRKVIKGKRDYIDLLKKNKTGSYKIMNCDAKSLKIDDESIDFVFTDFPYGDTVPYFEQSQLWNSWLKNKVDYDNEIVVSNSCERNKTEENFARDIEASIKEINRVLKNKSYFVFTFHSLSGNEWEIITNALFKNDFEFIDCQALLQKTPSPRQLNRKHTIKGDLIVVYRKNIKNKQLCFEFEAVKDKISAEILKSCGAEKSYDTNDLITLCVKCLLKNNYISDDVDFIKLIKTYFEVDKSNEKMWRLKYEI